MFVLLLVLIFNAIFWTTAINEYVTPAQNYLTEHEVAADAMLNAE